MWKSQNQGLQLFLLQVVPQYSGSFTTTLNGGTVAGGIYDRTWTPGSTVIQSSGVNITGLSQGDNIVITINE